MKANKTKQGYYRLDIVQDRMRTSKFVHRLVANAFLPVPKALDFELHHKDCNKENNSAENLEWLSSAEHRQKHIKRRKSNAELQ